MKNLKNGLAQKLKGGEIDQSEFDLINTPIDALEASEKPIHLSVTEIVLHTGSYRPSIILS